MCCVLPIFFLSCGIPDLEFDACAFFGGHEFGGVLYTDGGVVSFDELVLGVLE